LQMIHDNAVVGALAQAAAYAQHIQCLVRHGATLLSERVSAKL
jgi:hypothetical protein